MKRFLPAFVFSFAFFACARGTDVLGEGGGTDGSCVDCTGGSTSEGSGGKKGEPDTATSGAFELVPEYDGPCEKTAGTIDVNLGHSPENAVRALHCQINGVEPDAALSASWSESLRTKEYVRRIDVARSLCDAAGRTCSFRYSNPWKKQILFDERCTKKSARDLGAVFMYFSECPGGVNCSMDWANNHALGMATSHGVYGFGDNESGYYHPANTGFWCREFLDARYAGLSFLAVNTYGPDINASWKPLERMVEALDDIGGGIGAVLFDDTWAWGRSDQAPWNSVPNLSDADAASDAIYIAKWKPFFDAVPDEHLYKYQGKPVVYFYNAGTLTPRAVAAQTIAKLKQRFLADYGVEPFVVVDIAFFEDPAMSTSADGSFVWDTFRDGKMSSSTINGVTVDHFMARWDSLGRDRGGAIATSSDRIVKGPGLLEKYLAESASANIAVIGSWNDLGEGTGVHRNYDYYYRGEWLAPTSFLSTIRAAQCE